MAMMELSQENYLHRVLRTFNMETEHMKPVDTPMAPGPPLSRRDAVKYENGAKPPWPYRSMLGSVMYACITRLDIQYAIGVLAKFCNCPDVKAWRAVRHVLRYLRAQLEGKGLDTRIGGGGSHGGDDGKSAGDREGGGHGLAPKSPVTSTPVFFLGVCRRGAQLQPAASPLPGAAG